MSSLSKFILVDFLRYIRLVVLFKSYHIFYYNLVDYTIIQNRPNA
jgi:hypothetical protein